MAAQVFDFHEIDEFADSLLRNAMKDQPKRIKKFLNKQGYALRKKSRETAKALVRKRTGRYHKSFRKGKVYNYKGDKTNQAVRVYNTDPGAFAIEVGRRYKKKDGSEWFKPGLHVMETAAEDFGPQYLSALDDLLDELVDSL